MSVGKIILINKILNRRFFKGRNLEIILIIIKLWDLDRVKVIIENNIGKIVEIDFIEKCDFVSKDGEKVLRDFLKGMIDMILFVMSV